MSVIFAQQFRVYLPARAVCFLYYKGAGQCHSSNADNQIDNQEDKWLLLDGAALVLIFIFFSWSRYRKYRAGENNIPFAGVEL